MALGVSGCAYMMATPETVSLRVSGARADATVYIDDVYLGDFGFVQARGVAMPPGRHRITVQKAGYFPWDKELEVREGDPLIALQVELVPIPE